MDLQISGWADVANETIFVLRGKTGSRSAVVALSHIWFPSHFRGSDFHFIAAVAEGSTDISTREGNRFER